LERERGGLATHHQHDEWAPRAPPIFNVQQRRVPKGTEDAASCVTCLGFSFLSSHNGGLDSDMRRLSVCLSICLHSTKKKKAYSDKRCAIHSCKKHHASFLHLPPPICFFSVPKGTIYDSQRALLSPQKVQLASPLAIPLFTENLPRFISR
jgi:hypothetical protein